MNIILAGLIFFLKSVYYFLFYRRKWSYKCLVGKTAIITGGNSGIGYHTALVFASRGCRIILADCDNGEHSVKEIIRSTGNSNVFYKHLDLSSLENVRKFAAEIKKEEKKVDFLMNIAGITIPLSGQSEVTEDGLNRVLQVNYFGAFLLTHLMVDLLKNAETSNVIFMGSMSISFQNLSIDFLRNRVSEKNGMVVYGTSKFCDVYAGKEFGKRLEKYNIQVNTFDPLISRTPLFKKAYKDRNPWMFRYIANVTVYLVAKDPSETAEDLYYLVTNEEVKKHNGAYYTRNMLRSTPKFFQNRAICEEIWKTTEELVKLKQYEKII